MAQKLSRGKRKELGITITPRDGAYIGYLMKREGITQDQVAAKAGTSRGLVSLVLTGRKNSPRVKNALVEALAFPTWEAMINTARRADLADTSRGVAA